MIIINRDVLIKEKGDVYIDNTFFSINNILNYEALVDAIIELCITFDNKSKEE